MRTKLMMTIFVLFAMIGMLKAESPLDMPILPGASIALYTNDAPLENTFFGKLTEKFNNELIVEFAAENQADVDEEMGAGFFNAALAMNQAIRDQKIKTQTMISIDYSAVNMMAAYTKHDLDGLEILTVTKFSQPLKGQLDTLLAVAEKSPDFEISKCDDIMGYTTRRVIYKDNKEAKIPPLFVAISDDGRKIMAGTEFAVRSALDPNRTVTLNDQMKQAFEVAQPNSCFILAGIIPPNSLDQLLKYVQPNMQSAIINVKSLTLSFAPEKENIHTCLAFNYNNADDAMKMKLGIFDVYALGMGRIYLTTWMEGKPLPLLDTLCSEVKGNSAILNFTITEQDVINVQQVLQAKQEAAEKEDDKCDDDKCAEEAKCDDSKCAK